MPLLIKSVKICLSKLLTSFESVLAYVSMDERQLQSGTQVVDTLVQNGCFYQQFHSSIISFLLNAVNPLTPKSMLSEVKERLEGPKYNIDFGGKGLGQTGEGDRYVHYANRGHFTEMSQHFCPSLSECKIVLLHMSQALYDNDFN